MNYFKINYQEFNTVYIEAHNIVIALSIFSEVFPGFLSLIKSVDLIEDKDLIKELEHDLDVLNYHALEISF